MLITFLIKLWWILYRFLAKKIKKKIHEKRSSLVKYPNICQFLTIWHIYLRNPKKKNFVNDSHELSFGLYWGVICHDWPQLFYIYTRAYIIAYVEYAIFNFWYDLYLATLINLSYRYTFYNYVRLVAAIVSFNLFFWYRRYLNWYWYCTWYFRRFLVWTRLSRYTVWKSHQFSISKLEKKFKKKRPKNWRWLWKQNEDLEFGYDDEEDSF